MKLHMNSVSWVVRVGFMALMSAPLMGLGTARGQGFDQEWTELRKMAQQEGQLVAFICCGVGRGVGKHIGEFEEKYKIKVVFSSGASRQQSDRVLAERRAGKYSLDVWIGGITSANTRLLPAKVVEPMRPLLFNPEVLDKASWYGKQG
ncbi:MAG TPA: hypothetical protein VGB25_03415, partial [Candidatus Binatia bacterium]